MTRRCRHDPTAMAPQERMREMGAILALSYRRLLLAREATEEARSQPPQMPHEGHQDDNRTTAA